MTDPRTGYDRAQQYDPTFERALCRFSIRDVRDVVIPGAQVISDG